MIDTLRKSKQLGILLNIYINYSRLALRSFLPSTYILSLIPSGVKSAHLRASSSEAFSLALMPDIRGFFNEIEVSLISCFQSIWNVLSPSVDHLRRRLISPRLVMTLETEVKCDVSHNEDWLTLAND